ncbi:Dual specificity protein kinase [Pelomyxa schiedti]|nr:Dual specificity protein kinase [Pelomyxa schiedti]
MMKSTRLREDQPTCKWIHNVTYAIFKTEEDRQYARDNPGDVRWLSDNECVAQRIPLPWDLHRAWEEWHSHKTVSSPPSSSASKSVSMSISPSTHPRTAAAATSCAVTEAFPLQDIKRGVATGRHMTSRGRGTRQSTCSAYRQPPPMQTTQDCTYHSSSYNCGLSLPRELQMPQRREHDDRHHLPLQQPSKSRDASRSQSTMGEQVFEEEEEEILVEEEKIPTEYIDVEVEDESPEGETASKKRRTIQPSVLPLRPLPPRRTIQVLDMPLTVPPKPLPDAPGNVTTTTTTALPTPAAIPAPEFILAPAPIQAPEPILAPAEKREKQIQALRNGCIFETSEWPESVLHDGGTVIKGEPLGIGGFSCVYKATLHGEPYAIKEIPLKGKRSTPLKSIKYEALLLALAGHDNIIELRGVRETTDFVTLVMPQMICDLDTLIHYTQLIPNIPERFIGAMEGRFSAFLTLALQICSSVVWLHNEMRAIHRDIKPANFLLNEHFNVKLADFGLCCLLPEGKNHVQSNRTSGTKPYMAPEMLVKSASRERGSIQTDIYALGMSFFEMFTKQEILPEKKDDDRDTYIVDGNRPKFPDNDIEWVPQRVAGAIKSLIEAMWHQDASKRPCIDYVVQRLQDIRLQLVIVDIGAFTIWRGMIGVSLVASWDQFMKMLQLPSNKAYSIRRIALVKKEETLTASRFNDLVNCFKQFYDPQTGHFPAMEHLCRQNWFAGFATKAQIRDWLHSFSDGTFIVILNPVGPNLVFELCTTKKGKLNHESIYGTAGSYEHSPTGTIQPTITSLIYTLRKNRVLGNPCPSPYFSGEDCTDPSSPQSPY